MNLNISKNGILTTNILIEPFKILSDGSKWQLMLYHYVNNGTNLFTSSNADYCNTSGLFSRLRWINEFTYDNKYEFYVIQDDVEHRWTLTSLPTASSITGFTVISGNPVNGLAKSNLSLTYIGYNSWWGACGCWTSYTTGGITGIPGFGTHGAAGMCVRYLALYARIDNTRYNAFVDNSNCFLTNEIYEF